MEAPGIDPGTSRMLSERSTIWATPPVTVTVRKAKFWDRLIVRHSLSSRAGMCARVPGWTMRGHSSCEHLPDLAAARQCIVLDDLPAKESESCVYRSCDYLIYRRLLLNCGYRLFYNWVRSGLFFWNCLPMNIFYIYFYVI